MDAEELQKLPIGVFGLFIHNRLQRGITVYVHNHPVKEWPKMSDPEFEAIRAQMRERYSFQPAQPLSPSLAPKDSEEW